MGEAERWIGLLTFAPEHPWAAMALLAGLFSVNEPLRTALSTAAPRSPIVHALVCLLTLLPSFVMGAGLLVAGHRQPDRALSNVALAALLHVPWLVGGELTRLVRRDAEGADVGWICVGALTTLSCGVLAMVLFG